MSEPLLPGQEVIGSLSDWAQVRLSLDRARRITIDHHDEATLGRIYMQLIALVRAGGGKVTRP
jgi:hypothetical protein